MPKFGVQQWEQPILAGAFLEGEKSEANPKCTRTDNKTSCSLIGRVTQERMKTVSPHLLWLAHSPIGQSKSQISSTLVPRVFVATLISAQSTVLCSSQWVPKTPARLTVRVDGIPCIRLIGSVTITYNKCLRSRARTCIP